MTRCETPNHSFLLVDTEYVLHFRLRSTFKIYAHFWNISNETRKMCRQYTKFGFCTRSSFYHIDPLVLTCRFSLKGLQCPSLSSHPCSISGREWAHFYCHTQTSSLLLARCFQCQSSTRFPVFLASVANWLWLPCWLAKSFWADVQLSRKQRESGPALAN